MKKILLIPVMILIVLPIIYSFEFECGTEPLLFEENFTFGDDITNHGWTEDGCDPNVVPNNLPRTSDVYNNKSWGVNTTGEGVASTCSIANTFNSVSTGKYIYKFNQSVLVAPTTSMSFKTVLKNITQSTGSAWTSGAISIQYVNGEVSVIPLDGGDTCTSSPVIGIKSPPAVYEYTLELDLDNDIYNFYMNETAICTDQSMIFNGGSKIAAIKHEIQFSNAGGHKNAWDDITLCKAETIIGQVDCPFPTIFCDNFNYDTFMGDEGWIIQLGGGGVNTSFTPIDNKLKLQNIQIINPFHETEAFETTYRPDSGGKFTKHIMSPIFSSEFQLYFIDDVDNQFYYTAMMQQNSIAYSLKIEIDSNSTGDSNGNVSGDMNWYYLNKTQPSTQWVLLCGNCTDSEQNIEIKINSLFAQRDEFPFNTSNDADEIRVYADYTLIGTIEGYLDPRVTHLAQYEFGKLSDGNFTIDNYYVMVGTDKFVSTFEQYYTDFFDDTINQSIQLGIDDSGDMADYIGDIWYTFGLRSTASRLMTGMFLMFLLAITMFGASLSMGLQPSAVPIIIAEIFFMILLTYIRLLPLWLPFVVVLLAAGLASLVIKSASG